MCVPNRCVWLGGQDVDHLDEEPSKGWSTPHAAPSLHLVRLSSDTFALPSVANTCPGDSYSSLQVTSFNPPALASCWLGIYNASTSRSSSTCGLTDPATLAPRIQVIQLMLQHLLLVSKWSEQTSTPRLHVVHLMPHFLPFVWKWSN